MDDDTRRALEGSINKWESIVAGTGEDYGVTNCPLCAMFVSKRGCAGCPVAEEVDASGCQGTPYDDWYKFLKGNQVSSHKQLSGSYYDDAIALAQREVDFLKSLLPSEENENQATR